MRAWWRAVGLVAAAAGAFAAVSPAAAAGRLTITWGGDLVLGSSYAELAPGGRLTGGRVTSLLAGVGVPRRDQPRGAERLMRGLSRSDFGAAGVWFARLGTLLQIGDTGLGRP